jgi:hypothetical protein
LQKFFFQRILLEFFLLYKHQKISHIVEIVATIYYNILKGCFIFILVFFVNKSIILFVFPSFIFIFPNILNFYIFFFVSNCFSFYLDFYSSFGCLYLVSHNYRYNVLFFTIIIDIFLIYSNITLFLVI